MIFPPTNWSLWQDYQDLQHKRFQQTHWLAIPEPAEEPSQLKPCLHPGIQIPPSEGVSVQTKPHPDSPC